MLALLLSLLGGLGMAAAASRGSDSDAPETSRSSMHKQTGSKAEDHAPDHGHEDESDSHDDGHDDSDDHGSDHGDSGDHGTDDGSDDHTDHGTDDGSDDHTDHGTDDGSDDHTDHGTDDGSDDHTDHGTDDGSDDHGDHGTDDGSDDHADHGSGSDTPLPTTAEEIAAFVAEVRNGVEDHVHAADSVKMTEHMQVLDLVSPAEATHIAIGNGSWFDPDNWHNGEVPGDDAMVVIPSNVWMEYDNESDARLFTVRVDGQLDFAVDVDSKIVVDTFVVSPSGTLIAGTKDDPIEDGVNVDIVIAANGPIDTDWDPALLSRGLISHGHTEIHGQVKDSHEKVIEDPMAGDTSITFDELPEGWEVGDKIVIAGTTYEGYQNVNGVDGKVYFEPEDEVRYISSIEGDTVHFEDPLEHDHDTPRADLFTSVANYSRSVTVRSEDGDESEIFERGHVMMMHSDEVDIRFAAFEELGRTDKSGDLFGDNDEPASDIEFDSNVAGRYGLHLHRTGIDDQNNPTILEGNAVFGSPGWGIVHHDSHAILENNATYDTFGAGFVAETGNETGSWTDNIAIDAQGVNWGGAKGINEAGSDNFGVSGDGFWFTGRMVDASDNIAASVNHGFIYFHRATGKLDYDSDVFSLPEVLSYDDDASVNETPILIFEDNEAFASRMGFHVVKNSPIQGHDVHSVIDGFTAWNVEEGANLQYTAHYLLKDFDLIGAEGHGTGIGFGKNTFDVTIVNANITNFDEGLNLKKGWSDNINADPDETHAYTVINSDLNGNETAIANLTGDDDIIPNAVEAIDNPFLSIDPIYFDGAGNSLVIEGTKTDSLGTHEFVTGPDELKLWNADVVTLAEENGYYTDETGTDYMLFNVYFSDAMTGDVYLQPELMEFADGMLGEMNTPFSDARFNGFMDFDRLEEMTEDAVVKVRDADDAEARTVSDYETHAALFQSMDGEAVMAMLSNGETLSETLAAHEDEHDHDDMDM